MISAIFANGKGYAISNELTLPAHMGKLEIDYIALSLAIPERVLFRYKLDGVDDEWQDAGTRRQVFYTSLPPRYYQFHVIACNNDGVWNESGASLGFVVAPAYYQTWWFKVLCGLVLELTAWFLYRLRMHQKIAQLNVRFEERLGERIRIAQDLHDTLLQGVWSAAMHVHVATNRISDDSAAKPLLIQVQQLMDQVINEGRNALQGLRSSSGDPRTFEQAFSRIPQELGDQQEVAYRVIVEGSPRPLHPVIRDEVYRIGREALVNAFRHATARSIEIQVEYTGAHLRVAVRDDGCGIDPQVLQGRTGRALGASRNARAC